MGDRDVTLAECVGLLSSESRERKFMGKTYMGIGRSTFVIDRQGQLVHVDYKVKAKGHAQAMLERLAGQCHRVTTAFALRGPDGGAHDEAVTTEVSFRPLTPETIASYLDTSEWRDKAGAYAIQGIAGAFVRSIAGSPSNVIGLPLAEVAAALERAWGRELEYRDGVPA